MIWPAPLSAARPKRLRFPVFTLAGRIVSHAGRLRLRVGTEAERIAGHIAARGRLALVAQALASGRPSLVEIMTAREWPNTAVSKSGWWDVPVPTYLPNKRKEYEKGRAEEKL